MRNYIATCVIAAASLASCTQNEDFTSQYNEQAKTIKFDVAYVGKNTRAATGNMNTANLGDQNLIFWCDAYSGSSTPGDETTGLWISTQEPLYLKKSATTTYWDVLKDIENPTGDEVAYPGSSYTTYFTAIAPQAEFQASDGSGTQAKYSMGDQLSNTSTPPTFGSRKLTLENIPVVQEVSDEETKKGIDYLIACATSTTEEVALQFKHLLSKLRFAVWTDENTMATEGSETTKIELNSLKIYLPKDKTAKYAQDAHNDVKGTWTWNSYTAPTEEANPNLSDYQDYTLFDEGSETPSPKDIKYYANPTTVHSTENWENVKLDPNFFIAPTGTTTGLKLYIDIKYTVRRKVEGNWSTTGEISQQGTEGQVYSVGHKVVERTKMLVPVSDNGSYGHNNTDSNKDPEDRNEGLSHFHQGTLETLYICLRADQLVKFDTTFDVNGWNTGLEGWVDDPIDIQQK